MKTKTNKALLLKIILVLSGTILVFSDYSKCDAQSVIGKWKEVSGKDYCTPRGVKASGKQFLLQAPQMGGQVLEIRSDHTFTSSGPMNWVPSDVKLTGTWTLTGDQLNTKLDLHQTDPLNNPTKEVATTIYTLTINGNNMVLSLSMHGRSPIIERMEKTYTKM
jgi:hypothetical protein